MLKYKLYQNLNSRSPGYGKWYARAAVNETYDLEDLAQHMSSHNTPYSKGAIYGVLTDMVACIRELVLEGNAVKIPDLAIFSLGLKSEGVMSADDFDAAKNVKQARLRARSAGCLMTANVTRDARVRQYGRYDPAQPATGKPAEAEAGDDTSRP